MDINNVFPRLLKMHLNINNPIFMIALEGQNLRLKLFWSSGLTVHNNLNQQLSILLHIGVLKIAVS